MRQKTSSKIFACSFIVSILIHLCFFASWNKIPRRQTRELRVDKTRLIAISRYEKKGEQKKVKAKKAPKPPKPDPAKVDKPKPTKTQPIKPRPIKPSKVNTESLDKILKERPKRKLQKNPMAGSDLDLDRSKLRGMQKPKLVEDGFRGVGKILAREVASEGIGEAMDLSGFSIKEDRLKGRMKGFNNIETEPEDEDGLGAMLAESDRAAFLYQGEQVIEGEEALGGLGGGEGVKGEGLREISMKGLMRKADFSQHKNKITRLFGQIRQCLDLVETDSYEHQSIRQGGMSADVDIRNGRFYARFCSGMTINFNKSETGLPMVAGKQGSFRSGCSAADFDIMTYLEKSFCILQKLALHRQGIDQCL